MCTNTLMFLDIHEKVCAHECMDQGHESTIHDGERGVPRKVPVLRVEVEKCGLPRPVRAKALNRHRLSVDVTNSIVMCAVTPVTVSVCGVHATSHAMGTNIQV